MILIREILCGRNVSFWMLKPIEGTKVISPANNDQGGHR